MAKSITIPLGYEVDNTNNIGTLTQVSGYNYNATNITIDEVMDILGTTTINNLSDLCTSIKIKKHAAFKPNALGNDHGMAKNASDKIQYYPPTNTSGYKLGEFAGYNHSPSEPYYVSSSNIYFISADDYLGGVFYRFPEWDLRIDTAITHLGIVIYKYNALSDDYTDYVDTYANELTDTDIENGGKFLDYYFPCAGTSDIDYRLHFDLGYLQNGTGIFMKYCDMPYTNRTADSRLYVYKTAYYNVKEPVLPVYIHPDDVSGTDRYITVHTRNETLNTTTGAYSFDYYLEYMPMVGEDLTHCEGTCDFYAEGAGSIYHKVNDDETLPSSGWSTVTGTLSNSSYWPKPITSNVNFKFMNLVVTNSP